MLEYLSRSHRLSIDLYIMLHNTFINFAAIVAPPPAHAIASLASQPPVAAPPARRSGSFIAPSSLSSTPPPSRAPPPSLAPASATRGPPPGLPTAIRSDAVAGRFVSRIACARVVFFLFGRFLLSFFVTLKRCSQQWRWQRQRRRRPVARPVVHWLGGGDRANAGGAREFRFLY